MDIRGNVFTVKSAMRKQCGVVHVRQTRLTVHVLGLLYLCGITKEREQ